ncbi:Gfo/Idh/MocA family oxidoreductase [Kribbella sp. NPDC003505]|uniref:Gfo/Idh/MocA family protein n=1 Tax=Kribbella sp. NPDC003505 TaxID=3154448 RepID=UPI0033B989AB
MSTTNPVRGDGIRLAIVGLGAMGSEMLKVAVGHPEFDVVVAADISQAAVDAARTRHPELSFSREAEQVVTSTDVDAVYIATPPDTHAALVIRALRAGTAVFCEKPFAISLEDSERMLAASSGTGMVTAVNFALSDRNAVLLIEDALTAGAVGTVVGVDVRLSFPRWPREFQVGAKWLSGRRQGGFVREVFSHFAYLTDRLLGPLQVADARLGFAVGETEGAERTAHALLRAGDVPVNVSGVVGAAAPELCEWTLLGTKRSYRFRNWGELEVTEGNDWMSVELDGERGSEATRLSRFAAAMRGEDVRGLADFAAAFRVQQVVEAFHVGQEVS